MQGEKEKVRDTTEGGGQQPATTPRDEEPNPVGQDSARNEYGEIGDEMGQPGSFAGGVGGRQAEIQGEGFIEEDDPGISGQDFAAQGRGALEGEDEDVETGRSRNRKADVERQ